MPMSAVATFYQPPTRWKSVSTRTSVYQRQHRSTVSRPSKWTAQTQSSPISALQMVSAGEVLRNAQARRFALLGTSSAPTIHAWKALVYSANVRLCRPV